MRTLTLYRMRANDFATYGRIEAEDCAQLCVTLELPWVDADGNGKRDASKSRVVAGTYRCIKRRSPKRGYDVWWLCGVPDVSLAHFPDEPTATTCQLHRAALPRDLLGCIGIGSAFGLTQYPNMQAPEPGITGSKNAWEKFNKELADEREFMLVIRDIPRV